jgi:hypothetical protein
MAVGSNSLALLFKIGVDASDAQKQLTGITKLATDIGTAFKQGLSEGATKGAQDFEKATTGALQRIGTQLQQTRSGLENLFQGDVLEGTTQLVRQFGVLAVGLGAVAVAGLAVKKSIEGIIDVAEKVGTDSKDDFEELQKSMARVGETVTLLDHGLSQELLKSAGDVKTAFDAMFVEMLRVEGPALILLFKEVVRIIRDVLTPAADSFAARQVEGIVQFIGLVRGLQAIHNLPTGIMGTDFREWAGIVQGYVKQTRTELESLQAKLKGDIGDFAPPKAPRVTALRAQIDEFQKALDAAQKDYDAFKKKLDDSLISSMEDLSKQVNQQVLDQQKAFADRKQQWLDYAEFIHKQTNDIVKDIARQAQPIPGGDTGFLGLPDPDEVQSKLDEIDKHFNSFFGQLSDSILNSADIFSSFTDIAIKGLQGLTGALETTFQTFILTGQLGAQAFRTLTAALLSQLVIEAVHQVFKMHAKAAEEAAAALADAAAGDYVGATLHAAASAQYAHAAIAWGIVGGGAAVAGIAIGATGGLGGGAKSAAAGGEFGGPTQAPGTVTINQGGGATLGVLLSIDNHLSNITTAPPGDILQRGADQNPMAVGQANNEAARRDGTVSREFLQISGLRTA